MKSIREIIIVKNNSLKRKFIVFAVIIILPIATSNIISLVISRKITDNYNQMLNKMSITNDVKDSLKDSFFNFNKYLQINSPDFKELYIRNCNRAIDKVEVLEKNSDIKSKYILRDLRNSLESYQTSADKAIKIYDTRGRIDEYYGDYVSAKEISTYCNSFITKLSDSYLEYNNSIYNNLKKREGFIYKVLAVYICVAILLSILYTIFFIKNILDKLKELVDTSKRVSKGDFSYIEGKKINIYELDILTEAFTSMIRSIKKYINSIKEKAELESRLRNEEMKLLKYENALKMSQLKVLQSQINPHFLFNTLNCINQAAIEENALKTEGLIGSVAGMLRYSLSMMNRNATLEEEITVVKQYMHIQETRYGEMIKFSIRIDMNLNKVKVPGMTLQPFVENAFIHGIEPKEEGGIIDIAIYEEGNRCIVVIQDNGCGIEEDMLEKITSEDYEQEHIGHTTGMGIKSVVKRLEILYSEKDLFSIESKKGSGTKIYLKLPIKERV